MASPALVTSVSSSSCSPTMRKSRTTSYQQSVAHGAMCWRARVIFYSVSRTSPFLVRERSACHSLGSGIIRNATDFGLIGDFRELDGVPIKANSKTNFRVPPLNDRSWFQVTAALLDIEYSTTSKNLALRKIEKGLRHIGMADYKKRVSFLVIHDYWMPVKAETVQDAITLVCREMRICRNLTCVGIRPLPLMTLRS